MSDKAVAADLSSSLHSAAVTLSANRLPMVYRPEYNINFGGLEKVHPFDVGKWGRIAQFLVDAGLLSLADFVQPAEAESEDLQRVHTPKYLDSLNKSGVVAKVAEVPMLASLPNALIQEKLLKPFRYQTGGTVLAARLALDRGWAINIGGGFHHCSSDRGGGFCAYADISLAVRLLSQPASDVEANRRVMIVDLDAHQGNGYARDFAGDATVFILDAFNADIYPGDREAAGFISHKLELVSGIQDEAYLSAVSQALLTALSKFTKPDLVIYNAGTDIMEGDPLGQMCISPQGIIKRDQLVFEACRSRRIPVAMVTSGGYQLSNARVIADSILNLHARNLIGGLVD